VDRVAEERTGDQVGAELLRAQEISRRQVESTAQLVGQPGSGGPAPGGGKQVRVVRVEYLRNRGVIIFRVRAIHVLPVPGVGGSEDVFGGEIVVDLSGG